MGVLPLEHHNALSGQPPSPRRCARGERGRPQPAGLGVCLNGTRSACVALERQSTPVVGCTGLLHSGLGIGCQLVLGTGRRSVTRWPDQPAVTLLSLAERPESVGFVADRERRILDRAVDRRESGVRTTAGSGEPIGSRSERPDWCPSAGLAPFRPAASADPLSDGTFSGRISPVTLDDVHRIAARGSQMMRLMVERRVCPTRRRTRTPRRVYGENRCSEGDCRWSGLGFLVWGWTPFWTRRRPKSRSRAPP